jgi:hypothetical protein
LDVTRPRQKAKWNPCSLPVLTNPKGEMGT